MLYEVITHAVRKTKRRIPWLKVSACMRGEYSQAEQPVKRAGSFRYEREQALHKA